MPETITQKLNRTREEAFAQILLPETARKVENNTFVIPTADGFAKVTVSAIKDESYDLEFEAAEYIRSLAEKANKVTAKEAAKAKALAAKEAVKVAKEAAKKATAKDEE